jgi:hypothetical protein
MMAFGKLAVGFADRGLTRITGDAEGGIRISGIYVGDRI